MNRCQADALSIAPPVSSSQSKAKSPLPRKIRGAVALAAKFHFTSDLQSAPSDAAAELKSFPGCLQSLLFSLTLLASQPRARIHTLILRQIQNISGSSGSRHKSRRTIGFGMKYPYISERKIGQVAETKGFEPSRPFRAYSLSRGAPSTTRPRLRRRVYPRKRMGHKR